MSSYHFLIRFEATVIMVSVCSDNVRIQVHTHAPPELSEPATAKTLFVLLILMVYVPWGLPR
jgi:hypothetical protein